VARGERADAALTRPIELGGDRITARSPPSVPPVNGEKEEIPLLIPLHTGKGQEERGGIDFWGKEQ
jgi:hypothetical protein